jgi:UDP-3-O-[3-hydroxymyristoyl] glucosamine N-acyltransferase
LPPRAGVSGSSKIGENNILGGQVGIAGHLVIANNTGIGAQAGISKSIKEEGQKIIGSPAFDVSDYFKSYAVFKSLPDLNQRLRDLEKKMNAIGYCLPKNHNSSKSCLIRLIPAITS